MLSMTLTGCRWRLPVLNVKHPTDREGAIPGADIHLLVVYGYSIYNRLHLGINYSVDS